MEIRRAIRIVTIDGPSGTGKSTTARLAAEELGFGFFDGGSVYRAITQQCLEAGIPPAYNSAMERLLAAYLAREWPSDTNSSLFDKSLLAPDVSAVVADYSAIPEVRDVAIHVQRLLGMPGPTVCVGRVMGTVVFPDAEIKVFLDASLEVRAVRRQYEERAHGHDPGLKDVIEGIRRRDALDTSRERDPMTVADDAVVIDCSAMSMENQVRIIVAEVRARQGR